MARPLLRRFLPWCLPDASPPTMRFRIHHGNNRKEGGDLRRRKLVRNFLVGVQLAAATILLN
jgi:hypothetical protein